MAKISDTVTALNQIASTLNQHIGPIAQNLQTASGSALEDFTAILSSMSRTVKRTEQAITELSNDPSRIIWGGRTQQIPSYNGN